MGKVVRATAASDSSEEERRKTVRKEEKGRTKKKKCKRDLGELQRKLLKSKRQSRQVTRKFRQNNFVKLLQRFADIREEYSKETKIDGKSGKARNSKKVANRILPRRLVGIYRNGAAGKTIRRSDLKESLNDINNARLQGDVYKLLNGCDSESEPIIIENDTKKILKDPLLDSNIKNILQPTPFGDEFLSPVLGKVDGKKGCSRKESTEDPNPSAVFDFPQQHPEKKNLNNEKSDDVAMKKYEELCNIISAENFEGRNFPETGTDPLTVTKKKLRSMFAESFRSQCLRDMIKRGTVLNETATCSSKSTLEPETGFCSSSYAQYLDLTSEKAECQLHHRKDKKDNLPESQNIFILPEKFDLDDRKSEIPTSHLLFDLSLLNASNSEVENVPDLSRAPDVTSHSPFLRINHFDNPRCKDSGSTYFEAAASSHANKVEKNESPLFIPMEAHLPNNLVTKKLKNKSQRVQAMRQAKLASMRHAGKGNLKAPHQTKLKNLKHVPAILRRCNPTANSNEVNLFDESIQINRKPQDASNVLFASESFQTELNAKKLETSAIFDPADVQTCVIASPSLRKDEVRFKPQILNEMFFSKKSTNAPIQKTIMFTKKDSRNISDCLHLNSLITTDNPNVCVMKRSVSVGHEKTMNVCSAHKNCQRPSVNYHRCSEGSDGSYYCSQESNASQMQNAEVYQKPVCEKLLLRRVPHPGQKCLNDEHVCYVVVDSNNQECSDVSCHKEKLRTVHGRNFCQEDVPDVGILQGVQNLQILPLEEQTNECTRKVVLEEQPVKYLAVENNNRTQKIPIYMQSNRVTSVDNVEVINPGVNYRVVSCPQEAPQNVIFVPTYEQSKVFKQEKLASSFEEPRARKVVLYRPEFQSNVWCVKDPNVCKLHVPKQKMAEIRNAEREEIVRNLQGDKVKLTRRGSVNWDDLHYRSNHEYQHVNDACARNHTIFYQK